MIKRLALTTAVIIAVLGGATAAVSAQTPTPTEGTNASVPPAENTSEQVVGPGEQLSAVIGVQKAEIEGAVAQRRFGIQVAQAASANAKAQIVDEQLGEVRSRLETLESKRNRLKAMRKNGSISPGEYRARLVELRAKQRTAAGLINATNETVSKLPRETLTSNGVNVSAIQTLKTRASELTGPAVAKIARSIAGPPGNVPANGRPPQAGPPGRRNQTTAPANRSATGTVSAGPPDEGPQQSGNSQRAGSPGKEENRSTDEAPSADHAGRGTEENRGRKHQTQKHRGR